MTAAQRDKIEQHGRNLLAIFPDATERDPVKLCKKLRRLETQAHAFALRCCNGPNFKDGEDERIGAAILAKVNRVLGFEERGPNVWLNRDARGYALKVSGTYLTTHGLTLHQDWGGYGIIAPEIEA